MRVSISSPSHSDVSHPDVSFLVAARNAGTTLETALRSALAQVGATVQVVVVDDGSIDGTRAIAGRVAAEDSRITLLVHPKSLGPSAARNTALRAARGRWLAILDADDLVLPERSRMLLDLAEATSVDIVADNPITFTDVFDPAGATLLARGPEPYLFEVAVAGFLDANRVLTRGVKLGYLKPMIRTAFVQENELAFDESVRIGEDFLFCLAALAAGARFVVTSESGYGYRRAAGSLSHRLVSADVERLHTGYESMAQARGLAAGPAAPADRRYRESLGTARTITRVIEAAQAGRWGESLARALHHPDAWPFLAGALRSVLGKRLRRRVGILQPEAA